MPQVVLETEYDNSAALSLYESLGFIREKRLYRFYLNGKDAFRLVLVVTPLPPAEGKAIGDADSDGKSLLDSEPNSPLTEDAPPLQTKGIPLTRPTPILSPPVHYFHVPPASYDSDDEVSGR